MAKDFDAGRHFDQALLGRGQMDASLNQKTGNCLDVPAVQPTAWNEGVRVVTLQIIALQEAVLRIVVLRIGNLRRAHALILNRTQQF
jgi:hypothetical protein